MSVRMIYVSPVHVHMHVHDFESRMKMKLKSCGMPLVRVCSEIKV